CPLSELLSAFLEFMTIDEGWRGQTLAQNTATYRMFIAHRGDRSPNQYTRSDLTSFYDTLRKLPALYARSPAWRNLLPAEIVARTRQLPVDRLTMKTIKRHFSALGRLFTHFNKLGFYFTKWWSRYRRDVGVYEKGFDYHSFRHGVTTKLFAA